jgi:hypothetical protein
VTWKNPSTADTSCGASSCPWPIIAHSCMAADGSFADPSIRIERMGRRVRRERDRLVDLRRELRPTLQQIARASARC